MSAKSTEALIEELALSIARGFEESQNETRQLRQELRDGFAAMNTRLDRVEFLSTGQEQRISVLEDRVRQLATGLNLHFN